MNASPGTLWSVVYKIHLAMIGRSCLRMNRHNFFGVSRREHAYWVLVRGESSSALFCQLLIELSCKHAKEVSIVLLRIYLIVFS